MSGNWATGMRVSANRPAIVMIIAMTTASRGRSTKMAEIISLLSRRRRFCRRRLYRRRGSRAGRYRLPGTHALQPLADDKLALGEPVGHHGGGWGRLAELNAANLRLVLCINENATMPLRVRTHAS